MVLYTLSIGTPNNALDVVTMSVTPAFILAVTGVAGVTTDTPNATFYGRRGTSTGQITSLHRVEDSHGKLVASSRDHGDLRSFDISNPEYIEVNVGNFATVMAPATVALQQPGTRYHMNDTVTVSGVTFNRGDIIRYAPNLTSTSVPASGVGRRYSSDSNNILYDLYLEVDGAATSGGGGLGAWQGFIAEDTTTPQLVSAVPTLTGTSAAYTGVVASTTPALTNGSLPSGLYKVYARVNFRLRATVGLTGSREEVQLSAQGTGGAEIFGPWVYVRINQNSINKYGFDVTGLIRITATGNTGRISLGVNQDGAVFDQWLLNGSDAIKIVIERIE